MVGSENILTMPLPAEMHLPLSELQKQSEEIEYSELLDKVSFMGSVCKHIRSRAGLHLWKSSRKSSGSYAEVVNVLGRSGCSLPEGQY